MPKQVLPLHAHLCVRGDEIRLGNLNFETTVLKQNIK